MITVFALLSEAVSANPSYFPPKSATATATSSPVYMTPGTATTTLIHDSYYLGNNTKTSSISLLQHFTASTSASVVDHTVEYSDGADGVDCKTNPSACDWYGEDSLSSTLALNQAIYHHSSTTPAHRWGAGSATASTTRKLIAYQMPVRYIRFVFTQPLSIGSTNGAFWAAVLPVKERAEQ